jgi:hypothetical protein
MRAAVGDRRVTGHVHERPHGGPAVHAPQLPPEARARGKTGPAGLPVRERLRDGRLRPGDDEVRAGERDRSRTLLPVPVMALRQQVVVPRRRGLARGPPRNRGAGEPLRIEAPFKKSERRRPFPSHGRPAGDHHRVHVLLRVELRLFEEARGVSVDSHAVGACEEPRRKGTLAQVAQAHDRDRSRVGGNERKERVGGARGRRQRRGCRAERERDTGEEEAGQEPSRLLKNGCGRRV